MRDPALVAHLTNWFEKRGYTTSEAIFLQAEQAPRQEQIHLATYMVKPNALFAHGINVETDLAKARILRSTLMKPEHETWVPRLHKHIEDSARLLMNK